MNYSEFDAAGSFLSNPGFACLLGVVGANKPLYDIWGNTVNVASRMESLGQVGNIQCPAETAQYLGKANIKTTFRDVIFVKGKGNMHTYFVDLTGDFCKANQPFSVNPVPSLITVKVPERVRFRHENICVSTNQSFGRG